jgi:hypothetical protein
MPYNFSSHGLNKITGENLKANAPSFCPRLPKAAYLRGLSDCVYIRHDVRAKVKSVHLSEVSLSIA